MKTLITILARAGSRGLPGKNIKELCGKPLIRWTMDHAREFSFMRTHASAGKRRDLVIIAISSDDPHVKDLVLRYGAYASSQSGIYFIDRPKELAEDDTPKIESIKHAVIHTEHSLDVEFDTVIDLDVCNPLRGSYHIREAYDQHVKKGDDITVSVTPAKRNPYFNQVIIDNGGYAGLVAKSEKAIHTRQSCPKVWDLNCNIYVYDRKVLNDIKSIFDSKKGGIYQMPEWTCTDIDTEEDFLTVRDRMNRIGA